MHWLSLISRFNVIFLTRIIFIAEYVYWYDIIVIFVVTAVRLVISTKILKLFWAVFVLVKVLLLYVLLLLLFLLRC